MRLLHTVGGVFKRRVNGGRALWPARLLSVVLFGLVMVGAAEVAARAFWRLKFGVSFRRPGPILYAFYPELGWPDFARPSRSDDQFDVLLLGGSVLHPDFGNIQQELREQLALIGHRKVRIFSMANPAHTSRDSWLKYSALTDARFDLVVFYHGINETRANNVPPELYQLDYSHFAWYQIVNALAPYHRNASFALPYTARYLALRVEQTFEGERYVPMDEPVEDWLRYGKSLRSVESFEQNLGAILDLARERGDPVLMMTFALYVPDDYSLENFRRKRLDYGLHNLPVELWGRVDDVAAAVAAQNEVVRRFGSSRDVLFVDQARLIPGTRRHFNDPCHLTGLGSYHFVANLVAALPASLQAP